MAKRFEIFYNFFVDKKYFLHHFRVHQHFGDGHCNPLKKIRRLPWGYTKGRTQTSGG